jgi:phenylpropionate dioxygenase-like ring-hydroxylating dioxygenase large terminal subunit
VKVPFTWRVTGWWQVGWSHEFPIGEVRPLHYFGEDMVAWRGDDGELHVLEAHCQHLGAHIGYGGKVVGSCVQCPFHGWQWGGDGYNVAIPDQAKPNRSKHLRVWHVVEQYGLVFLWHHPHGEPPGWEMLDIFASYPQFEQDPAAYYDPFPMFIAKNEREPVHPQIVLENSADSAHFEFVHRSSIRPLLLDYTFADHDWYFIAGWPDASGSDTMRLKIHSKLFGLGGAITAFEGAQSHRVVFSTTPVETGCSDMYYTIWWPREPGDDSPTAPPHLRERVEKEFLSTVEDDLLIWRTQKWIEHPAYSKIDAKGYTELRKWSQQFYDVPPEE